MEIITILILGLIVAIIYKFCQVNKIEKFFNVPEDKLYFIYAKTCGNSPNVQSFENSFNTYAETHPLFKAKVELKTLELLPEQVIGCIGITDKALQYQETPVGLKNIMATLQKGQTKDEMEDSEIVKQSLLILNENNFQGGYQLPLIVYVPKGTKEITANNIFTEKVKDFYTNNLDIGVPGLVYRNEMGETERSNIYIINWLVANFWSGQSQLIDENTIF